VSSNDDLYGILGSPAGARVGGSKPQRLERILDYCDRMVFRAVPDGGARERADVQP
jgi:hypothetical protein